MNNNALRSLSYGMYIVSSYKDGQINGQIANTAFQITSDPVVVGVSINKENTTHEFIEASGVFAISVLDETCEFAKIGKFGFRHGCDVNKFEDCEYEIGESGAPLVLTNTNATMEFKVVNKTDFETHTVFYGEMTDAKVLCANTAMTYDYYHNVIKGKSPKTAPTYIKED